MKVLVVRAERGRVVESSIVEGELDKIVKDVAREVLEEWDPRVSEFVVLKDVEEATIKLPIPGDVVDVLRPFGLRRRGDEAVVDLPYYTISFDNRKVNDDYVEYKVVVVAPYINDDFKAWIETLAAEIVSEKKPPEGIKELE